MTVPEAAVAELEGQSVEGWRIHLGPNGWGWRAAHDDIRITLSTDEVRVTSEDWHYRYDVSILSDNGHPALYARVLVALSRVPGTPPAWAEGRWE